MPRKLETICRAPIICPGCGRTQRKTLRTFLDSDQITCNWCGCQIDISGPRVKAMIRDIAQSFGEHSSS